MVIRSLGVNRNEMNGIEGNFEKRNQGCFIVGDLWHVGVSFWGNLIVLRVKLIVEWRLPSFST